MVGRKVSISFLYKEIKLHKFISTEPLYLTLIFIYEPFWAFSAQNINEKQIAQISCKLSHLNLIDRV